MGLSMASLHMQQGGAPFVHLLFYGVVLCDAGIELADGGIPFVGDGCKICCCRWVKLGVRGCSCSGGISGGANAVAGAAGGHDGDAHADSASTQASNMSLVVFIGFSLGLRELCVELCDVLVQALFAGLALTTQPGGIGGGAALQVLQLGLVCLCMAVCLVLHASGGGQHDDDGVEQRVCNHVFHVVTPLRQKLVSAWRRLARP
nr:MAG TPA: hypothetical protein [Caudoviricetes sp.]